MKNKFETSNIVKSFVSIIETQYETCVKRIRSDNGPEFNMKEFYPATGIQHQMSYVESLEKNGCVERKHQHVLYVAIALIHQSKFAGHFLSLMLPL
jgi:hypothetical protein